VSAGTAEPKGIGAALALGGLAAAIAALPDVRRVAEHGVSPGLAWLGLTGGTALLLGPLLVLARAARRGSLLLGAALVGGALAAAPVSLLGQALKLNTHLRPLGAATFGFLALAVVLASVLFSVRVSSWALREVTPTRRAVRRLLTLSACMSVGLVVLRALSSEAFNHDTVDACRLLAVAALASRALDVPLVSSLARRAGTPSWVLLVLLGLLTARGPVKAAIHERAPVLGGPTAWL
jgi:hypothetical protein